MNIFSKFKTESKDKGMRLSCFILVAALFAMISVSCKRNPLKVDISGSKQDLEIVRFEKELFSTEASDRKEAIRQLREKYPDFFDLFTYRIINIGGINDSLFFDFMGQFLKDTMIISLYRITEKEFADFDKIEQQLNQAFKYYQYHFPGRELPVVYTYISGFNQSVVTAEKLIGISLDKYLGRDCAYYRQLNSVPMYKTINMHKDKIASDVAYAWGITEFEKPVGATTLLDNMIYQGKIMYFVDALLPEMEDSLKIGYTAEQLKWCQNNEAQMWRNLIERKMLFSNQRMDIIRYINPGPTTSGFPLESPGRTGVWLGWQIVRKYMKKFPETALQDLMDINDFQKILNDSEYFPE